MKELVKMSCRVLFFTTDGETQQANKILRKMGMDESVELVGCGHAPFTSPTAEQLEGCDAVIAELTPIDAEEARLMANSGVKIVASMSIGINHMDVNELTKLGIYVTNCPGYCAQDVALHTVALMLDLMRQISYFNRSVRNGGWDPKVGYEMRRPQGQTLGLVFFGHIANEVAPSAQALGMKVLVWAPTKTKEFIESKGCEKAQSLEELLTRSDVVSLHCPLIPETKGLIGADQLKMMKNTAFLINTARGELIDEDALADALDSGEIMGAAMDVMCHEAKSRNQRLVNSERCVITPHAAYVSEEAADVLRRMTLESVCDLMVRHDSPRYCVNESSVGN